MAQDVLADGFVKLCISTEANWYGSGCRVLVEGQMLTAGSATPNKTIEVTGTRFIDSMFGAGSPLAESLKVVFCTCPSNVKVFALPRSDNAAGVAAVYGLTFTGPATSDGRVTLFWGNSTYNIDFRVREGDTAANIATLFVAEVPSDFPFTAATSTETPGVVTLIAKNKGTVGNGLNAIYNWADRLNYAPSGVGITLAQMTVGSGDPLPATINYKTELGNCCYSCYILASGNTDWQELLRDHIRDSWDCAKPQCFGHAYTYNTGTLGQVLSAGDNSAELSRLAVHVNDPVFPYLTAAAYGAASCCIGCTNPEINIQGPTNGILSCIRRPQTCDVEWTWDEVEQLRDNAFVTFGPSNVGSGSLTNLYVFNDVTNYLYDENGRENATFRDVSSRRLATSTAISLAEHLQTTNGLSLFTKNTNIRTGVFGTNPRLMLANIRAWAKSQVGVLFSEFSNINEDIQLLTDFEVQPECLGKPGVLHLNMLYRPPTRINSVNVNLVPKMLDNCER